MITIVLDRNYRSTQAILNAANKLIAYNKLRQMWAKTKHHLNHNI